MRALKRSRRITFAVFIIPAAILYTYFCIIPFIEVFYYSFTDWNGMTPTMNFIGFKNFTTLLKDKSVWQALKNNLIFCFFGGFLVYAIAFVNSVLLTQSRMRGKEFYQNVLFIPQVLSIVIVSIVWMFIYNPKTGILNTALRSIGLDALTQNWLGDKKLVVYSLVVLWTWCSVGFYQLLISSAISSISMEVSEAALIDGATKLQRFNYITLPLIRETIKTSLVFFFTSAFSGVYALVDIMTNGGPAGASEVMTTYMYTNAFGYSKFGYSSAIGIFVFFVIMLVAGIMMFFTRSKE